MDQQILNPKDIIDILLTCSQLLIAAAVGWIAWRARIDSKRSSIASLLPIIESKKRDVLKNYMDSMNTVLSKGFEKEPIEMRAFNIERLESAYKSKRGLDFAEQKLLEEADSAWRLENSFQQLLSEMNPNQDKEHKEWFKELREKHL